MGNCLLGILFDYFVRLLHVVDDEGFVREEIFLVLLLDFILNFERLVLLESDFVVVDLRLAKDEAGKGSHSPGQCHPNIRTEDLFSELSFQLRVALHQMDVNLVKPLEVNERVSVP